MPLQPTILIAEDKDDEAFLLERALKRAAIANPVVRVRNGDEVIEYLSGSGTYADRARFPLPMVLLLDLNMPKKSGFEVLEWIRTQPALAALAVDVFSGSSRNEDIERALKLGARLYLKKPITNDELDSLLGGYRQITAFRGFAQIYFD
jgi:CheY-like chemotaxis protein